MGPLSFPAGHGSGPHQISDTSGGFTGVLDDEDDFGASVASWGGDLDADGNADLVVGAIRDGDGGFGRGPVWILFLDGNGCFGEDTLQLFSDGFGSAFQREGFVA